jgi:hypothetical protein
LSHDFTQWWKDWWEEDYSWEGLANKPWAGWCVTARGKIVADPSSWPKDHPNYKVRPRGARDATLQDYWWDQKDALIVSPISGKAFTILHLPLVWEDGRVTPDVEQLEVLRRKYTASAASYDKDGYLNGPDNRLLIKGAVLRSFVLRELAVAQAGDERVQAHISARRCFFVKDASFQLASFSGDADFNRAAFCRNADFNNAAFAGNSYFRSVDFSGSADWYGAAFWRNADFNSTTFSQHADFDNTIFSGDVDFNSVAFVQEARFNSAAFSGEVNFDNTAFRGKASFAVASFSGNADFSRAAYSAEANFRAAAFSENAHFDCTDFSGNAYFNSAVISGYAHFNETVFAANADFDNAAFFGTVYFRSAIFSGYANFKSTVFAGRADFNSATFLETAHFNYAAFMGFTNFESSSLLGDANFDNATFSGSAIFNSAAFFENTSFNSTAFSEYVSFSRAAFSQDVYFKSAIFAQKANFGGLGVVMEVPKQTQSLALAAVPEPKVGMEGSLTIPKTLSSLAQRSFKKIDASGAVFLDEAIFDNRDIHEPASFRDCLFMKRASFHGSKLHQGVSFHGSMFEACLNPARQCVDGAKSDPVYTVPERALTRLHEVEAKRRDLLKEPTITYEDWLIAFEARRDQAAKGFCALPQKTKDGETGHSKDRYFADLEDAFRTLKRVMEDNRNRPEEGRFFKLELQARRRRRLPAVPWWERAMSDLYRWSSDYGMSVVRPVVGLGGTFIVFAFFYTVLAIPPGRWPTGTEIAGATSFSLGRVLPIGPWADEPEACSVAGRLLDVAPTPDNLKTNPDCRSDLKNQYGPFTALGVRLLASLQSFIALVLIFLAALASRRRFQIN